jgi:hypothetical protein
MKRWGKSEREKNHFELTSRQEVVRGVRGEGKEKLF